MASRVPPKPVRQKREKISDTTHESFARSLGCVVCGDITSTEVAHVSYPDPRFAKYGRAYGRKEESVWVIPLCGQHHRKQHSMGERAFWQGEGIDPVRVAAALYIRTGDAQSAAEILAHARDP
jgi:hypothetical protein